MKNPPAAKNQTIKIDGYPYDIILAFPIEEGYLVRMIIQDKAGRPVQTLAKPLSTYSASIVQSLGPYIPLIKEILLGSK